MVGWEGGCKWKALGPQFGVWVDQLAVSQGVPAAVAMVNAVNPPPGGLDAHGTTEAPFPFSFL